MLEKRKYLTMIFIIIILLTGCKVNEQKNIENKMNEFLSLYNKNTEDSFSGSILIAKDKDVIYKESFGMADYENEIKNSADTIFPIGSITKSFTSVSILQLKEEGKIDLDDKISKYIGDLNNKQNITIHQLLTHSSGLQKEGLYSIEQHVPLDKNIDFIKKPPLLFNPGQNFSYSNAGYIMLAKIIEEVSGVSYNKYIEENIFKPLEMNNSFCGVDNNLIENQAVGYNLDNKNPIKLPLYNLSIVTGSGNIYSNVEDMQKYISGLLNGKLISEESLNRIKDNQLGNTEDGYSYGFFLNNRYDKKNIYHSGHIGNGGYNSLIKIFPDENYYMIYLTNNDNYEPLLITSQILEAILFEKEYALPKLENETELSEKELKNYKGDYLFDEVQKISVLYKEGYLYTTSDDGSLNKLIPSENNEFYVENHPLIRVKFLENENNYIFRIINVTNVIEGIKINN
jgi:CubicO group peptidase (beta-lactamase class C family)